MKLTLVTPEKRLVTYADVDELYIPAYRGELNILPQHAPIITLLESGILKYRAAGDSQVRFVAVSWGYCEIHNDQVSILAETAEVADEIDYERAKADLKKTQEKLAEGTGDLVEFEHLQSRVLLDEARMHVFDTRKLN
jgi:F-type H+-transporting ATPase subunit epsilon